MSDPAPHAPASAWSRNFRRLLLCLLSVAFAFYAALLVAATSDKVHSALTVVAHQGSNVLPDGTLSTLSCYAAVQVLVAVFLVWAGISLGWDSWRGLGVAGLAAGIVLAYLVHDDPVVRRVARIEDVGPSFPGAEQSFALLMEYSKDAPKAKAFKAPAYTGAFPYLGGRDNTPEKRKMLLDRRAEMEANWRALAPQWEWWRALDAFDRIGDLTPARMDAPLVSFQVLRAVSQHGTAVACLQAIDGRGDAAIETLLPIIGVGRKLQPYSRTMVRSMIAIVIERLAIDSAGFVLDTAPVSPRERARLAEALRGGDPAALARHIYDCEYAFVSGAEASLRAGDLIAARSPAARTPFLVSGLNWISPVIYNPHATLNLVGDVSGELAVVAGHRDTSGLKPRLDRYLTVDTRPRFKNLFGLEAARDMMPPFNKVTDNFWLADDLRTSLLARLEAGK